MMLIIPDNLGIGRQAEGNHTNEETKSTSILHKESTTLANNPWSSSALSASLIVVGGGKYYVHDGTKKFQPYRDLNVYRLTRGEIAWERRSGHDAWYWVHGALASNAPVGNDIYLIGGDVWLYNKDRRQYEFASEIFYGQTHNHGRSYNLDTDTYMAVCQIMLM